MESSRNQVIDAFRAVAILSVMAFHYLVRWTLPHSPDIYGYDWVYPSWLHVGRYGVNLFFVISGLVITMTVLRSKSAADFAIRRFSRLWPPLVVAAAFTMVAANTLGPPEFQRTIGDYLASLTFYPTALGQTAVDGAYWSLSVEVTFYGVVALAFVSLRARFWCGVVIVAVLWTLAAKLGHRKFSLITENWSYFLFGMGVWYGLFERKVVPALWLLGTGAALFAVYNPGLFPSIYISGGVAAMIALFRTDASIPFLPWLGRRSYSIYLVHQKVGVILIGLVNSLGAPDWLSIAVTVLCVLAVSIVLYEVAEMRGQRLVRSVLSRAQSAAQLA
jgi:peptidoglycan/LPS O-acetylase OafA/YrhL